MENRKVTSQQGAGAPRLSAATLGRLPAAVAVPRYDRRRLRPGIVHLGLGAFFRAHGALYTEDVIDPAAPDWGIVGASLRKPDQRDRLAPQDGLYVALERGGGPIAPRVVGNLSGVIVAAEDPSALLARLVAPETRIVSLTVTEKGYCHDPATGALQHDHPDILHDLAHPDRPRSAIGFLVAALAARRKAGLAPVTPLSCDNLPHNGRLLHGLLVQYAALGDDALSGWIAREVPCPATMVDRIVPAVTEADIADALAATGFCDAAPVSHEPFRQWVIEDRFVDGQRPPWQRAGAELVGDVAPYETMKLRLLNGAHSALAYLGFLGGCETIGDAVADRGLSGLVARLWREEIIPVLTAPPGVDLVGYTDALVARFANPAVRHCTWQIAMDGSQKLPQRLLDTVRQRRAAGLAYPCLALVVAAWIRYVGGVGERGETIDVRDPLGSDLRAALDAAGNDPEARVGAALGFEAVFGADLGRDKAFLAAVSAAYRELLRLGALRAAAALAR
jgi:fructuronate reductase